jgi:hypothetical protein
MVRRKYYQKTGIGRDVTAKSPMKTLALGVFICNIDDTIESMVRASTQGGSTEDKH